MKTIAQELEDVMRSKSQDGSIYIKDLIAYFGDRSLIFIIAVLSLPIALPFTPPGINTIFAVVCLILILRWMIGSKNFKLPNWVEDKKIPFSPDGKFFIGMKKLLNWIEFVVKARNERLISSKFSRLILGFGLLSSSTVMLIPLPIINSASSLLVLLISVSILSKDGRIAIIAAVIGILLLLVTVGIVAFGVWFGQSYFK